MRSDTSPFEVSPGAFKAGKGKKLLLAKPCHLVSENGTVKLQGRTYKPGSGWLALLATFGTFIVVVLVAQAIGFAAGPGYLIWYFIIRSKRKEDIELDLSQSTKIIADDTRHRIAIEIPVDETPAWIGIGSKADYEQAKSLLSTLPGATIENRPIKKSKGILWLILIVFILAMLIVVAVSIPNLIDAQKKAKERLTLRQISSVVAELYEYQAHHESLPEKLEDLVSQGYYANDSFLRDAWGNYFFYQKSGDEFILKSLGQDGIESPDDIMSPYK